MELQFYPNSITAGCSSGGGYNVTYAPNVYTACSPVWEVSPHGHAESAAFNAMLTDAATAGPLEMHAGDMITDHQYVTPAGDGMHITVTDLTTGHSGTIVLVRPLGRGVAKVAATLEALAEHGYDGWLVLEQDTAITADEPAVKSAPMHDAQESIGFLNTAQRTEESNP
jgi:hypothetical protein